MPDAPYAKEPWHDVTVEFPVELLVKLGINLRGGLVAPQIFNMTPDWLLDIYFLLH
jgi:hypothetical protein